MAENILHLNKYTASTVQLTAKSKNAAWQLQSADYM